MLQQPTIDRDTYRFIKKMSREELCSFLVRYANELAKSSPSIDLREVEKDIKGIRGIDGLAALVQQQFQLDLFASSAFLFCGRRRDRMKVLLWEDNGFLLLYAPEYNPDELVNSDLKRSVGKKASPNSKEELEHNVRSHLKSLQLNPSKISSFFHAPYTKYAA